MGVGAWPGLSFRWRSVSICSLRSAVLLDRLLSNLDVRVDTVATCTVAPGWRLQLPAPRCVTLHFVIRGSGLLRARDGRAVEIGAHHLVLVPDGLPHGIQCGIGPRIAEVRAEGPDQGGGALAAGPVDEDGLLVVCGRLEVGYGSSTGVFDRLRDVLVIDFADEPRMVEVFRALRQEQSGGGPGAAAAMAALMTQCLVHVFRRLCGDPDCTLPWLHALEDPQLAAALDRILTAPGASHTVESLARTAHMSRATFARRFRDAFGTSPMAYVRDVRLREAAAMLRTDPRPSVDRVAREVGFRSRSRFSRAFSARFGVAPSAFR